MKLSVRGQYALRALIVLAEANPAEIVPIHAIAERQQISKRFLEQILNDLKNNGFVESKRGISGGYRLARPPQKIGLDELFWHLEGPWSGFGDGTMNTAQKAILSVVQEAQQAVATTLGHLTLADLCERARQARNSAADYAI